MELIINSFFQILHRSCSALFTKSVIIHVNMKHPNIKHESCHLMLLFICQVKSKVKSLSPDAIPPFQQNAIVGVIIEAFCFLFSFISFETDCSAFDHTSLYLQYPFHWHPSVYTLHYTKISQWPSRWTVLSWKTCPVWPRLKVRSWLFHCFKDKI